MKAPPVVLLAVLLAACAHGPHGDDPVVRSAAWLQGSFDNAAQVRDHPGFLAVQVRWTPIWTARDDGRWFLVEQSLASTPGSPYRRRVHRLRPDGAGGVVNDVFMLPTGAVGPVDGLAPEDLEARPACALHLRPAAGGLRGATRGRDCISHFRGAAWTTAEVWLTADGFASWDRGFAADGRQVWGAVDGPYEFRRRDRR